VAPRQPTAPEPSELVAPPAAGRVFEHPARPGFADCAPSGRTRLDGLARWLQDVAYADVAEAGMADAAVWVLRRARIHVRRWPRFGQQFVLATFCSGLGRMWAERRTTVAGVGEGPDVEAVALWVHLDPQRWRPAPLSERELALYGPSAGDRRVTARLRHGPPPPQAEPRPWTFRATELDIAEHINNSAYWQPLEDELLKAAEPRWIDVEIEFRTPAQPGKKHVLADGGGLRSGAWRWSTSPGGEVHASMRVRGIGVPDAGVTDARGS
jgi:acyl-ACP thioesterase